MVGEGLPRNIGEATAMWEGGEIRNLESPCLSLESLPSGITAFATFTGITTFTAFTRITAFTGITGITAFTAVTAFTGITARHFHYAVASTVMNTVCKAMNILC